MIYKNLLSKPFMNVLGALPLNIYLYIHFQILTKEMLNRTDVQECIAENINKAIIPTDLSMGENLNESMNGEGNTSIVAELNNVLKSIVEATESDPVFEKFVYEYIGPYKETETSPEDDDEGKLSPKSVNECVYILFFGYFIMNRILYMYLNVI